MASGEASVGNEGHLMALSNTLFFNGRIRPEWAGFTYSEPILLQSVSATGEKTSAAVSVRRGRVSVKVEGQAETENDVEIMRYYAETVTRAIADAYGFTVGAAFDVEIAACVNLKGEQVAFGIGFDDLQQDAIQPQSLLRAALMSPYLQRALADYRLAIQTPHDTAFYAYRAIESMREHFRGESGVESEKKAWERMRGALDLTKEALTRWKSLADLQRHGVLVDSINQDERVESLRDVADVIVRLAKYLLAGQPMPTDSP